MNRIIETDRLILRPFHESDAEAASVWLSDPRVNRYMPYPLYSSVTQAQQWIATHTEEDNEFIFVLKTNNLPIGAGSIKKQEDNRWEVGYNLRYDYWGSGYATEAAKALILWAYKNHQAHEFMARHATANTASGNVLKKCGYQFDYYGEYDRYDGSEVFPATYYKMTLK